MLCGENGMIYNFILYQGAETEFDPRIKKLFGLGGAVVLQLTENIKPNTHYLFFDNYFANYNLFEILLQKQIYAASTIRANRFLKPPFMTDRIMASKGPGTTHEIRNSDNTMALVKWYDNKAVYMCSNFIGSGTVDNVPRWDKKIRHILR